MESNAASSWSGIVNLDKPAGISSAFAVARVKKLLPRGTKIGHAGTLDPFATGVLLLLVGKATKLCESLMSSPKQYEATIKLGANTATDDCDASEEPVENAIPPTREAVEKCLSNFVGVIQQRPPTFSAMKVAGRRAYDLARKGKAVELQPRPVRVDRIEVLGYDYPLLRVRIDSGRGVYIRSIARDAGQILQTGGYLTELRRTRVGDFHVETAVTLQRLAEAGVEHFLNRANP